MPEKPAAEPDAPGPEDRLSQQVLDHVRRALRGLRYGEVTIIVQDGVVVQVDRLEKQRLDRELKKQDRAGKDR